MSTPTTPLKGFDCVEMKRRIQEKIYAETKGMNPEELLAYFRQRVAASRFAHFFGLEAAPGRGEPGSKNGE